MSGSLNVGAKRSISLTADENFYRNYGIHFQKCDFSLKADGILYGVKFYVDFIETGSEAFENGIVQGDVILNIKIATDRNRRNSDCDSQRGRFISLPKSKKSDKTSSTGMARDANLYDPSHCEKQSYNVTDIDASNFEEFLQSQREVQLTVMYVNAVRWYGLIEAKQKLEREYRLKNDKLESINRHLNFLQSKDAKPMTPGNSTTRLPQSESRPSISQLFKRRPSTESQSKTELNFRWKSQPNLLDDKAIKPSKSCAGVSRESSVSSSARRKVRNRSIPKLWFGSKKNLSSSASAATENDFDSTSAETDSDAISTSSSMTLPSTVGSSASVRRSGSYNKHHFNPSARFPPHQYPKVKDASGRESFEEQSTVPRNFKPDSHFHSAGLPGARSSKSLPPPPHFNFASDVKASPSTYTRTSYFVMGSQPGRNVLANTAGLKGQGVYDSNTSLTSNWSAKSAPVMQPDSPSLNSSDISDSVFSLRDTGSPSSKSGRPNSGSRSVPNIPESNSFSTLHGSNNGSSESSNSSLNQASSGTLQDVRPKTLDMLRINPSADNFPGSLDSDDVGAQNDNVQTPVNNFSNTPRVLYEYQF